VLCGGIAIYKQSMAVARQRELFDSLNLTEREVGMCYLFFRRIDQDDSGSISVNELMDYLKLGKSALD
jgi:Ca2+-binding EF-hand superfamily protein